MHSTVANITVFPGKLPDEPVTSSKSNAWIVILTEDEHDEVIIKYILGNSCRLTTCSSLAELARQLKKTRDKPPDLVLVRNQLLDNDPELLISSIMCTRSKSPFLVLSDKTCNKHSTKYLQTGARDVVSLDLPQHLRAVVKREVAGHRLRGAYRQATACLEQYRSKLDSLAGPTSKPAASEAFHNSTICDRVSFVDELSQRLASPLSQGVRALAWIRPDQFAAVQESLGFLASEEALVHIATALQKLLHPDDFVGRIGGIVFAVYIERGTMKDVEAWLRQFGRTLSERSFGHGEHSLRLTCTTGIAGITSSDNSIDRIFKEAHAACHRGRLHGQGQICLSEKSQSKRSFRVREKNWARRILHALKNDHFEMVYSPIVRLDGSDDKIRDAWVRMTDDKGSTILATEFVPAAQRLGLMVNIDRWVIAATLTYCTKRKPDLVFVRLSEESVIDDSLATWLGKLFRHSTVRPSQICLQTTEIVARQHLKQIARQARKFTDLGLRFAIDQIGATAETLNILQFVPVQYARIDPALLQRVAWDKAAQKQVSKFVSAARKQGIHTIADRVEDAATMATLCQLNVEFVQGDYVRRDNIVMEDTMTHCRPALPATGLL